MDLQFRKKLNMKSLCMILFCLLSTGGLMAQETKPARIQGTIKDFKGGLVTMSYDTSRVDTLQVNADGTFDYLLTLDEPQWVSLVFEYYGCNTSIFIENGMQAELFIDFVPQGNAYELQLEHQGDNADCTEFMDDYLKWAYTENPWTFARIDTLTFAEYRESYLEDLDTQKGKLMKVKSMSFRKILLEMIDINASIQLFRFVSMRPKADADFERWVETFDRNDMRNISLTYSYLQWYQKRYPAAQGESKGIYYLITLKKLITNQEVINSLADVYIKNYLGSMPKDTEEVYAYYKTLSTNKQALAEIDSIYSAYKNLVSGGEALDFVMENVKGKQFNLSDFKGKAVYIDVWATWCGPCKAEIPYMEKLAAHYAKNKKIELISISIDEDREKWEKILAADKPEWKQFIAPGAWQSELCGNYHINSIPRFLFFDKDGKVISLNAPRPSSKDIIEYIDKHLAK